MTHLILSFIEPIHLNLYCNSNNARLSLFYTLLARVMLFSTIGIKYQFKRQLHDIE